MHYRVCIASLLTLLLSAVSFGQIIYTPVEYQYSAGGTTYYYGGSDPRIHQLAREPYSAAGTWGRVNGWAFVSATREVASEPLRVFTDSLGAVNAHLLGFTVSDARNEANASLPRYFVKRDLLRAAQRVDGVWEVPASAQPIRVYGSDGRLLRTAPATLPHPLMIIPKDQLQTPRPNGERQVAIATRDRD